MFDRLEDERVHCTSIMTTMTVGDFLGLVDKVYYQRGGIEGQRAPLKTKTAISIRKRMVSDLEKGAVIPPIVVGVLVSEEERHALEAFESLSEIISKRGITF